MASSSGATLRRSRVSVPPMAPGPRSRSSWLAVAAALTFPVAAILHQVVFFRPRCMLNGFGRDYDLATLRKWLTHDPSPWLAVVLAVLVYRLGRDRPSL